MKENSLIAQVKSLPQLIREELPEIDRRVRKLLSHNECLSIKRIVIAGCGDSHMAGLATEMAFEEIAGIPTEPMTAMQAARFGVIYQPTGFPRNPLVLGISVSGAVARTCEAIGIAREKGALTVGVTANPEALLGQKAERVLDCTIPDFPHAPGVRSYHISLMALYLLAIRLAEVSGRIPQSEANSIRQSLKDTAFVIESTIELINDKVRELAVEVCKHQSFIFTGVGSNYSTAIFGAAKVIEATGRHAMGQDTEEWAHLQYFENVDPAMPTFVISPGKRDYNRVIELLEPMKRIGRTVIAIVPQGEKILSSQADWVLPVVGDVREVFTPMVYAVAGELFAAHLADVIGEPFFRRSTKAYLQGDNTIRSSNIIELNELEP